MADSSHWGASPLCVLFTNRNHFDPVVPEGKQPLDYAQWNDGDHLDEAYANFVSHLEK
jgi:hypothetical protein